MPDPFSEPLELDESEEEFEEQALCKPARREILRLFSDAVFIELKIRELNDEDAEEREEKAGLQVELSAKVKALSQFREAHYVDISKFQPLIDGPAVVEYGEELICWFKSGVRRACMNACELKRKIPPQCLSKRMFHTDKTVRLQCQHRLMKGESQLDDIRRTVQKKIRHLKALQIQEDLASLLMSCNTTRIEIEEIKSSLQNNIPIPMDISLDDLPIVPISSLAGGFAETQVSKLIRPIDDCKQELAASAKILCEGIWEKLSTPLAVAATICEALSPECTPKQEDKNTPLHK